MGLRRSFWFPFFGVPRGALGSVGARVMPTLVGPLYSMMARQLDLQPEDDVLDVGCGAARMLAEQASHVRYVAGVDASEIQVKLARDGSPSASPPARQRWCSAMPWRCPGMTAGSAPSAA